jgi:3-hydroxyacyl-[acyl-carrier-protein] dehydratase
LQKWSAAENPEEESAMPPEAHFDLARLDLSTIVADQEAIRRVNPQRFEMEHLDAVTFIDREVPLIIGYKDVRADEFWVRGHMPGFPLLPGVLMCEAGAQLCAFLTHYMGMIQGDFMGFGGMENVRFRGMVHVGDRLVLIAKGIRMKPRQTVCNVQGFVGTTMVFHGDIMGVGITRKEEG